MIPPRYALVRPPGDSLAKALSDHPDSHLIDPELARRQHARFCEALEALGLSVVRLPVIEELPDSCFTADTAIVFRSHALLARAGATSRREEVDLIVEEVRTKVQSLRTVEEPATVDGGDVFILGDRIIVGRSLRTNDEGVNGVKDFGEPLGAQVDTAEVPAGTLHLLTSASPLSDNTAIGVDAVLGQSAFDPLTKLVIPDEEALGCNVVSLGADVIVASGYPALRRILENSGRRVHEVDLSEFEKADGGPSCLLLLI